jgi:hypothetical protein
MFPDMGKVLPEATWPSETAQTPAALRRNKHARGTDACVESEAEMMSKPTSTRYFESWRNRIRCHGCICLSGHLQSPDEGLPLRPRLQPSQERSAGVSPNHLPTEPDRQGVRQPQGEANRSELIEDCDVLPSESLIGKPRMTGRTLRRAQTIGQGASVGLPPVGPQYFCRQDFDYLLADGANQYNYSSNTSRGTFLAGKRCRIGPRGRTTQRDRTGYSARSLDSADAPAE